MAAGGDLLGVSVSGAIAAQRALNTTSHNIANTNTDGYSRQRVDMGARAPQMTGSGGIGTGVLVNDIHRVYDDFVVDEMRNVSAKAKAMEGEYEYSTQLDDLLADPDASLAPAIQEFFAAVNTVSNNPSSTSERQVMLSQAKTLANRFDYMYGRFSNMRDTIRTDLRNMIVEVNQLAGAIAKVNQTIDTSKGISDKPPSDLLDQRDRLIYELSRKISVRVTEDKNGQVNVFIGNGQLLVFGQHSTELAVDSSAEDPENVDILYKSPGIDINITRFIDGGEVGGVLKFRENTLDSAQNELGRIAVGIANKFNEQHRLGMDLDGDLGVNFFREVDKAAPAALPNRTNKGDVELDVDITNIDNLTTSDYELSLYDGEFSLIRKNDNTLIGRFSSFPQDFSDEGFNMRIQSGSNFENGDKYIIRPTRAGANRFEVTIDHINKIAAASPIRTEASIDNVGTGEISVESVLSTDGPIFNMAKRGEISPPMAIRFVDEDHFEILDNTGKPVHVSKRAVPAEPVITKHGEGIITAEKREDDYEDEHGRRGKPDSIETKIKFDRELGAAIFPTPGGADPGIRIHISGRPKAGDTFRIEYNTDGIGDNSNALNLARLQDKATLSRGTADFSQVYSQLVSRVGARTHELEINHKAQSVLLDHAISRREEVSGVNMDEEAANLVRYQKLYQANAQVISVAKNIFDTLIATFNR